MEIEIEKEYKYLSSPEIVSIIKKMMTGGFIKNDAERFSIPPEELFQEGLISVWVNHDEAAGKNNGEYLPFLAGKVKYGMRSFINSFYKRKVETLFSEFIKDGVEVEEENDYLDSILFRQNISNFAEDRKNLWRGIEEKVKNILLVTTPKKSQRWIPDWLRYLELICGGYSYIEISSMEGISRETIRKAVARVIKTLQPHFPSIELKKVFSVPCRKEAWKGKTLRLFGAIKNAPTPVDEATGGNNSEKVFSDFSQMTTKEIREKFRVSRTSAWRAKKQGWLMKNYFRKRKEVSSNEIQEIPIIGEFYMPERNKPFWAAVRLGVSGEEWKEMWEWAHGLRPDIPQELLTKAKAAAIGG